MNDYEINLRLAEIAEVRHYAEAWQKPGEERKSIIRLPGTKRRWRDEVTHTWYDGIDKEWSPLTDWSQLGPLMERFETDVLPYKGTYQVDVYVGDRAGGHTSTDLKRAICLAIIGAHENA